MRSIVVSFLLMSCIEVGAASVYWDGITLYSNGHSNGTGSYDFLCDSIQGDNGKSTWMLSSMYGHVENGNMYLKQYDYSKEMMDATFNWWAFVVYGEIVNEATFHDVSKQIETFYSDQYYTGGTLVENPNDFYMAFKASEVLLDGSNYVEGQSWYGWIHVSIDENLEMTLLGEGINLYGGEVIVGSIPEPHSGLLLLVGGALLALRRRRWNTRFQILARIRSEQVRSCHLI